MTALEELQRDPASRKRFLKMMGGAGAASALGLVMAACGSSSNSSGSSSNTGGGGSTSTPTQTSTTSSGGGSMKGDLALLNYALTLEHLETDFYMKVEQSGLFKGKQASLLKSFGDEEAQHVDAIMATIQKLGGTPAAAPKTKFPIHSATQVAKLAATVENLGAAAYLGAAPMIQSKEILAAALSIHSVEGRHAATLNELVGKSPTPEGAFAKGLSVNQVLPKVKPFIVG